MSKFYAGIGSRQTPAHILPVMEAMGRVWGSAGWTLRSGGAAGADSAFEAGARAVGGTIESWNPRLDRIVEHPWAVRAAASVTTEFPLAAMKPFVRNLIVRSMYQVLGEDGQSPVSFVMCWTPTADPCDPKAGGTRYACRLARAHGIPVHNLANPAVLAKVQARIEAELAH